MLQTFKKIEDLSRGNEINFLPGQNYVRFRMLIGVSVILFPVVVVLSGLWLWGIETQYSLSHYYFALSDPQKYVDLNPIRKWFCGFLFVVGAALTIYRGYSDRENQLLTVAGIGLLGVAIFPMQHDGRSDWAQWPFGNNYHGVSALVAALLVLFVMTFLHRETLDLLREKGVARVRSSKLPFGERQWISFDDFFDRFRSIYAGICLVTISLLLAVTILHVTGSGQKLGAYTIIILESLTVFGFGSYWLVKTWEIRDSDLDFEIAAARHEADRAQTEILRREHRTPAQGSSSLSQ